MISIDALFNHMDAWRHFPNYQLERRSDIFFSLYLPEVLSEKLRFPVRIELVPEFPVHKRTIGMAEKGDKSYKIDYVALAPKDDTVVLVELKTDGASRNQKQDDYLSAARETGLTGLIGGLLDIFMATQSKPKYFSFLLYLESLDLLTIPMDLKEIMARPSHDGANKAAKGIKLKAVPSKTRIAYVQPCDDQPALSEKLKSTIITFRDFAEVVNRHEDPVSQRFAESLIEWASIKAGEKGIRSTQV